MVKVYVEDASIIRVSRYFDKSYKDLVLEVVKKLSLESLESIDYIVVSSLLTDSILHQLDISTILTQYLGATLKPALRVEAGESSGLAALEVGYNLVRSGIATKVLVVGVEKLTEYPTNVINENYSKILDYEVETLRNITPPDYAALAMKEYIRRYGISREDMTAWPIKMHENAIRNPYAQLRFTVNKDRVLSSVTIAEPIKLLDTFPIGDGAAALLLTSRPESSSDALEVIGIYSAIGMPFYLRDDILKFEATRNAWSKALSNAGVKVEDSLFEIHDSYTIYAYLIMEELGLARRGKAFEEVGTLENINLSGGLKARGHPFGATAIYQVAEVYTILTKGLNGVRSDATYGVIHSMSGPDYNSRICVLRRVM